MPIWHVLTHLGKKLSASSNTTVSPSSRQDYQGKPGRLLVAIPEGRKGVVRLTDSSDLIVQEDAVSVDGTAIPSGTEVLVVLVRKHDVVVMISPVSLLKSDEEEEQC